MTDPKQEIEKLGAELAASLAEGLNRMGYEDVFINGFLAGMDRQHRTLQQNAGRLVVAWLRHMSEIGDRGSGHYDLRNEGLVKFAQSIKEQLDQAYLPFV